MDATSGDGGAGQHPAPAGFVLVTTTVAGVAEARDLAGECVRARLAACVQFLPIASVYRWKGKVESADEQLLLCKTRADMADALVAFIRGRHAYEVPEIVVLPIRSGYTPYLEWIASETGPDPQG